MIKISKIECLDGLKTTIIYFDSHPQYKSVKQQLLSRREIEQKNGLFSTSYNQIMIDNEDFNLNYAGELPTPSYSTQTESCQLDTKLSEFASEPIVLEFI